MFYFRHFKSRALSRATCILFFSHTAAAESKRKQLCRNKVSNEAIADLLIKNASKTLDKSGIPWRQLDEKHQFGSTFGERLSNCAAKIFEEGYANILIVGNDCPTLSIQELQSANRLLNSGHQVLGKDNREGAYLIGLNKDKFDQSMFAQLPWQTKGLASALHNLFMQQGLFFQAEQKGDINSTSDLQYWIENSSSELALSIALVLKNTPTSFAEIVLQALQIFAKKGNPFRGPPVS